MLQKVVTIINRKDASAKNRDLAYWLSKTPEERVAAVEFLRRQFYGSEERLQRVTRVVNRVTGETRILSNLDQSEEE